MPVYNCENFLSEAIESILNQTFDDLELIIIDDGSTDGTRDIINNYKDLRINFIEKGQNTGLISSLNLGIELSRGEFIARMDGDDISHTSRFEKQVGFLKLNQDVVVCGTWFQLLSTKEVVKYPLDAENIKIGLLDYCALAHPTVMVKRDFITSNKLIYNVDFIAAEDYDMWTRIAAIGKIANLPESLLYYRYHSNQVTVKDQYNQVKNSNLCRIRMLCYPLNNPTDYDINISKLLVQNDKINDFNKLQEVVGWLNDLFNLNRQSGFYAVDPFRKYIGHKKAGIIRNFYLHTSSYNLAVLYHFNKMKGEFRGHFTLKEYTKFVLKCVFFWK